MPVVECLFTHTSIMMRVTVTVSRLRATRTRCVFYYCRIYYKAVRVGGEESGTCAMRDDEPRPVKGGCPRHRDDTIVRACRVRCLLFSTREIAMTAAKSLPALFLLSPALLRAELLPCSREQSCCLASKTARKTVLFLFVPGLSLSPIIPLPPPFPVAGPLTRLHKHAALPAGEEASVGQGEH